MTLEEARTAIAKCCNAAIDKVDDNYFRLQGCEFMIFLHSDPKGTVTVYYWSGIKRENRDSLVGAWLQRQLNELGFGDWSQPNTQDDSTMEGHAAELQLTGINWRNLKDEDLERIKNLYDSLVTFQKNSHFDNDKERKRQVSDFNKNNSDVLQAYVSRRWPSIDISVLKDLKDIKPETHAGCYELVQKAIELYGKQVAVSFTVDDLNLVYSFIRIDQNVTVESKIKGLSESIGKSSLTADSKATLQGLLLEVQGKASRGEYSNENPIGIVGAGSRSFRAYETSDSEASELIKMLVRVFSKGSTKDILDEASKIPQIKGVKEATLSALLHCLKPNVFPIWNGPSQDFFPRLPLDPPLRKIKEFPKDYIEASERLNKFREDNKLPFMNWRALDILAYKLNSDGSTQPTVAAPNTPIAVPTKSLADPAGSRNLIFFGAPGTGKSFKLQEKAGGSKDKDGIIKDGQFVKDGKIRYERVTFYPTYSYAQFVGCYKPVMKQSKTSVKECGVEEETEILTEDELATQLRNDFDNATKPGDEKKVMSVLSFPEKYVSSFKNGISASSVVKKAGIPQNAYLSMFDAALILAKERLQRVENKGNGHEEIAYEFVPGPFLRVLVDALKEPDHDHCLVIEEINRANAAAVFGDVFQLLDRGGNGESDYDVAASADVKRYLKNELAKEEYRRAREFLGVESNGTIELDDKGEWKNCHLRIPFNMYIWATMNSADQGVFPLDTAFKRRWEFEYVDINGDITDECKNWTIGGTEYKWNDLRVFINGLLSLHNVNEDKLMGPWFVKPEKDSVVSDKQFKSKVLMYLWEDAARMCRAKVFADDITTFSELLTKWESGVSKVFKCDSETLLKIRGKVTAAGYNKDDVSAILGKFGYNPAS